MAWIPIRYRDFYDFPRAFLVEHEGSHYFFDCPFNSETEEYGSNYCVFRINSDAALNDDKLWTHIATISTFVAELPTTKVQFDSTRRETVDDSVFLLLPGSA